MSATGKKINRRSALKVLGLTAGGTIVTLSGCGPAATPAPTFTPLPSIAPVATPTPGAVLSGGAVAATYEEGQAAYGTYEEWHPSSPVDLLIWGPPIVETDPWIIALQAGLDRFMAKYPEIKVTWEPVPWEELDTKVNAAIAAHKGPDVVFESDREAEFPRRGIIRPMDDVVDPNYISGHKFYEVRPIPDNRLYWVHSSIMGPILFTNKALLAEAGYKPEDVPTKWEDFGTFCQDLTKFDGDTMTQAGFSFNNYARYIWNDMVYQQGSKIYMDGKANINTPESENAWQMLLDFYDKYKINDRTFLNFDEAFGTGKSAISQVWTWFGSTLEGNYPDVDWAPAMYPTFTGEGPYGRFDYDGPAWMVSTLAEGDKEKAAWELIKYHMHDYQFLVERSHTAGLVLVAEPHPDYDAMFSAVAEKESPTQAERREQALAVLSKEFAGGMVFPGEVAAPFDQLWAKMQDGILLNNTPIKEALTTYQAEYEELLKNTNFWITPEG